MCCFSLCDGGDAQGVHCLRALVSLVIKRGQKSSDSVNTYTSAVWVWEPITSAYVRLWIHWVSFINLINLRQSSRVIYETFVCRQSHRMKDRTLINVAAENNRHLNITPIKTPRVRSHAPKTPRVRSHAPKTPQVRSHAPKTPQVRSHAPKTPRFRSHAPRVYDTEKRNPARGSNLMKEK